MPFYNISEMQAKRIPGMACVLSVDPVLFAAKSPVGSGDMAQDYSKAKDAEEVWRRLSAQTTAE